LIKNLRFFKLNSSSHSSVFSLSLSHQLVFYLPFWNPCFLLTTQQDRHQQCFDVAADNTHWPLLFLWFAFILFILHNPQHNQFGTLTLLFLQNRSICWFLSTFSTIQQWGPAWCCLDQGGFVPRVMDVFLQQLGWCFGCFLCDALAVILFPS
jgi:hypothetical protein